MRSSLGDAFGGTGGVGVVGHDAGLSVWIFIVAEGAAACDERIDAVLDCVCGCAHYQEQRSRFMDGRVLLA